MFLKKLISQDSQLNIEFDTIKKQIHSALCDSINTSVVTIYLNDLF